MSDAANPIDDLNALLPSRSPEPPLSRVASPASPATISDAGLRPLAPVLASRDGQVLSDFTASRSQAVVGDPVAAMNAAFGGRTSTGNPAGGAQAVGDQPPPPVDPAASDQSNLPLGRRVDLALKRFADQAVIRPNAEAGAEIASQLKEIYGHLNDASDNERDVIERGISLAKAGGAGLDLAFLGPVLRAVARNYIAKPIEPMMFEGYDPERFSSDLAMLAQVVAGVGGKSGRAAVADEISGGQGPAGKMAGSAGEPGSSAMASELPEIAQGESRYVSLGNKSYVAHVDGSTAFGEIPADVASHIGVDPGSIMLPQGAEKATGELHMIRGGKAAEIAAAGYHDVGQMVDDVGHNFNEVFRGDGDSLILVKRMPDPSSPMMFVEISHSSGGPAWEVKSGGIYRDAYTDGKELLWRGERTPTTATGETVPHDASGPGKAGGANGNATAQSNPADSIARTALADNAPPGMAAKATESDPFGFPAHEPPPAGQAGGTPRFAFDPVEDAPKMAAQAKAWANGEAGPHPIQASLEALSGDGELDAAIQRAASYIPEGAVKHDDALRMGAYALQKSPEDVLAGFGGKMPTDAEVAAMGILLSSAAKEAWSAAKLAVATGTPEAWNDATRAFTLQNRLIGQWEQAGSEQARAFRARQLTWSARDDYTRAVQQVLAEVGPDNIEQAVRGLAMMDDPAKAAPYVSALRWMTGRDGILFARYNMLLSNPTTVIKKLASDATVGLMNLTTRAIAENFGSGAVAPGETAALFSGYVGSMGDAIRAAGKALKAGRSQFEADSQSMDGVVTSRLSMLANGAPEALPTNAPTQAALSYLRSALPTSWIGAADDFAKVANYRAELRALAYRDGWKKLLDDAGAVDSEAMTNHIEGVMNNPPPALHEQARAAALSNTFQDPLTGVAARISDLVDSANVRVGSGGFELPVGRILMPFVKVPANILKFAYRTSPLPLAFPTDGYLAELAAGGARRDIAQARVGLGTAVTLSTLPFAIMGNITGGGPSDPEMNRAWRAAGNQPYSARIGGEWYQYNRIEPVAQMLGAVADTADIVKFAHSRDGEQAALSLAFGIGNSMLSKTYMSSVAEALDALHSPDRSAKRFFDNLGASLVVPQGVAGLERANDPWVRAHYDLLQTIESRIPGWGSSSLPPQRTMWGDPVAWKDAFMPPISGTGAARMLSPVATSPDNAAEPIDKWIWDNRSAFAQSEDGRLGLTKPNKLVQHFEAAPGVSAQATLTPEQLDRYQVLAGNGLKDPRTDMGAKDTLNALVTGSHPDPATQDQWNGATAAAQALMVQKVTRIFRDKAKTQLLSEFPDLGETVRAGWATRAQTVTGTPVPGAINNPGAGGGAVTMPKIGG